MAKPKQKTIADMTPQELIKSLTPSFGELIKAEIRTVEITIKANTDATIKASEERMKAHTEASIKIDFFPNKSESGDPGRWEASSLL